MSFLLQWERKILKIIFMLLCCDDSCWFVTGEQLESEYLFVIKEYDKNMQSVKEMLLERMDNKQ